MRTLDVTDGVLPMLRVQPMLGRTFSKTDDTPGSAETVLLTAGYWRARFGADRSAVGRTIMLDSRPREIIGVLPDSFRFLDVKASVLTPLRLDRSKTHLGNFSFTGIARLKPGVTIDEAQANAARIVPIALHRFPPFPGGSVKLFEEARITPSFRTLKRPRLCRSHGATILRFRILLVSSRC